MNGFDEIILLKLGEVVLKGNNRYIFEDILMKNIKRKLSLVGDFSVRLAQSTLYVQPLSQDIDLDVAVSGLLKVFGIAALSRAAQAPKDMDEIKRLARQYLTGQLREVKTFKVEAKRSDKSFPLTSPEICAQLGSYLCEAFPHLEVDVHRPQLVVHVEVRDFGAYVHAGQQRAAGGIPVSSSGRAALLISGGIDSPVAGYMMAKRGLELIAVHFESPPYTSERAKLKVLSLLEQISGWCGRMETYVVPFTEFQEQIKDHCPEELFTVIMRRYMMKITERIANAHEAAALITGESVGQVASQTVAALACTDIAVELPVLRPLVGMDKEEIIKIARHIGTFELSTLPYEDCCTVFTPRRPRTRPKLEQILKAEQALDGEALIERAVAGTVMTVIRPVL